MPASRSHTPRPGPSIPTLALPFLLLALAAAQPAHSQPSPSTAFAPATHPFPASSFPPQLDPGPRLHAAHTDFSRRAMFVLGGWAIANLAVGVAGRSLSHGRTSYFHEMNAAWNTVNLSIAAFSLYSLRDAAYLSLPQTLQEAQTLDTILLLNVGLDAAYIATGGYLIERGLRLDRDRLVGYGRSLLLQGGFLLAFDLVLHTLHAPITAELFERATLSPTALHPFPASATVAPLSSLAPALSLTLAF